MKKEANIEIILIYIVIIILNKTAIFLLCKKPPYMCENNCCNDQLAFFPMVKTHNLAVRLTQNALPVNKQTTKPQTTFSQRAYV